MRKAKYAGMFYPDNPKRLKNFIEYAFSQSNMDKYKGSKIIGGIVPHAGYAYSGKTASYFYKLLKSQKQEFEIIILLGANHSSMSEIVVGTEDFEIPFGVIKNSALSSKLRQELKAESDEDEHSIEVQLPLLHYALGGRVKRIELIPILIRDSSLEKINEIADKVYNLVKDKKVLVIASSDFTHYGSNYGFVPFSPDDKTLEKIRKIDMSAIEQIVAMNTEKFMKEAEKTTICGSSAVALAIELCRLLGSRNVKFLHYETSAEVSKDVSNVVGYASLVFI